MLSRFFAANRNFCDGRLAPRLYAAPHIHGIDYWMQCWLGTGVFGTTGGDFLEFGCGEAFYLCERFGSRFRTLTATDVETPTRIPVNVTFEPCTARALPFRDNAFDTIGARSVFEHVPDPSATFMELNRVLRPGGSMLFNLPNKWDYVSVIARAARQHKHRLLAWTNASDWDDFPVTFRCNTRRDLQRALRGTPLEIGVFRPLPSEPHYLRFFVPFFVLGACYQFAISLLQLDALQPAFVVALTKPRVQTPD